MSEYDQTFDPNILIGHCDLISRFSDFALQGVKKVRRHYNIPYNFTMNTHTISTFKTAFNINLHSIIKLRQLLF